MTLFFVNIRLDKKRWRQVWAIWRVNENFPAQLQQLLARADCSVWSGVVVQEANRAMVRTFLLDLSGQSAKLIIVEIRCNSAVGWKQLIHDHPVAVPPYR